MEKLTDLLELFKFLENVKMATMRTAMIIAPVEGGIVLTGCSQGHLARWAGQHYDDYGDDDFSMVMMLKETIMMMLKMVTSMMRVR